MFFTYLRRELSGRRKQTVIVAIGLGLAIALALIMNSVAAGAQAAQATTLKGLYGIGTDISVTAPADEKKDEPSKERGGSLTDSVDDKGNLDQSELNVSMAVKTLDAATIDKIRGIKGVSQVAGSLELINIRMTGTGFPTKEDEKKYRDSKTPPPQPTPKTDPIKSTAVTAIDPKASSTGPLSSTKVTAGRQLNADDVGKTNAVVDATYATTNKIKVGDKIKLGKTEFTVVGTVQSTTTSEKSSINVYIPLDQGQTATNQKDKVSAIYVKAASSDNLSALKSAIQAAAPGMTVNTQEDLATTIKGTVAAAASTLTNLSIWVSVGVLAAAFLLAALFTIQGVTRRTREFGTLKALGWSNRRVVGQVAGESFTQGLIGGAVGIALGATGIWIVNLMDFKIGGQPQHEPPPNMPKGARGGMVEMPDPTAAANTAVSLVAPFNLQIVLFAVALAVLGGLIAGVIGGWRASLLRPAAALRDLQ